MRHAAAVLSLVATLAVTLIVACGDPTGYGCDQLCSCADKADDAKCISDCNDKHDALEADATHLGCKATYDDFQGCLDEYSVCDHDKKELVVPVHVCSAALEAFITCEVTPTASSTSSSSSSSSGT